MKKILAWYIYALLYVALIGCLAVNLAYAQENDNAELPYLGSYLNYEHYSDGKNSIAVFSQLYHHDAEGNKIDARWYRDNDVYRSGYNHFDAMVDTENITVWNNYLKGSWLAKPFIKGKEVELEGISIHNDRLNHNYNSNVLYYDYGQFRREVRIIEGMITSTWVFDKEPDGDIFIEIKKSGNIKFKKAGAYDADGEPVEVEVAGIGETVKLDKIKEINYPLYIGDSPETFYPDADPETSTVDGCVLRFLSSESWAVMRAGAGTHAYPSDDNAKVGFQHSGANGDNYRYLYRGDVVVDTSPLVDTIIKTSVELELYGSAKLNDAGTDIRVNVYGLSDLVNDNDLVPADYDIAKYGSVEFCDNEIAYADWNLAGYNKFTFNNTGTENVSLTDLSRYSVRTLADVSGVDPDGDDDGISDYDRMDFYTAEKGIGFEPRLIVAFVSGYPLAPDNFEWNETTFENLLLTWDKGFVADKTIIRGVRGLEYPATRDAGVLVYYGTASNCTLPGLSLDLSTYLLRGWSENNVGYSVNHTDVRIGGEIVEIAIALPTGLYVLIAALALVAISIFYKRPLIYLAIIPCMIGVVLEPAFKDLWFQSGCILVAFWAALSFWKTMSEGRQG